MITPNISAVSLDSDSLDQSGVQGEVSQYRSVVGTAAMIWHEE